MNKRVGILIEHGVEFRHFVLSGIVQGYRRKGYQVILLFSKNLKSPYLSEYIEKYSLEFKLLERRMTDFPASIWEGRLRSLRNARKIQKGEPLYSHFLKTSRSKAVTKLLAKIAFVYNLIHRYGLRRIRVHYLRRENIQLFKSLDLNRLVLLEYTGSLKTLLGIICNDLNIECDVFLNTLKTPYINDFLPFRPNNLFAWTKDHEVAYYKSNWYHRKGFVKRLGSPFHTMLRVKNVNEIDDLCKKYSIDVKRPLVTYSMIFEKVYKYEHLIIQEIYNYLNDNYSENSRPQLAIRRNPFEESTEGLKYLRQNCPDLVVCDHYWERDVIENWSLQAIQGEIEWRALLYQSDLVLNIPSMSTIDALMTRTRTGNIYFNHFGDYNDAISHILESPFSKIFRQSSSVRDIRDVEELGAFLDQSRVSFRSDIENAGIAEYLGSLKN